MTLLDPIENAAKCDLLAGKPGGIFSRWDHIRTPKCRKRLIPGRSYSSECDSWNYLKPTTVTDDEISVFRPVSSVYETRFHRGFSRKMYPEHSAERNRIEIEGIERYNKHIAEKVQGFLDKPRNIVTGLGFSDPNPTGKRAGDYMIAPFRTARRKESRRRVASSVCRFHGDCEPAPVRLVPCESVMLGFSKGRLRNRSRSAGVYDNFSHTQLPLETPPSSPTRRNDMPKDVRPHILTALIYDMTLVSRVQSEISAIVSNNSWVSNRSVALILYYIMCRLVHKSGITLGEELTEIVPRGRLTFMRRFRWLIASVTFPLISDVLLPRLLLSASAAVKPKLLLVLQLITAVNDASFFLIPRMRGASIVEQILRPVACDPVEANPNLRLVFNPHLFLFCGAVCLANAAKSISDFMSSMHVSTQSSKHSLGITLEDEPTDSNYGTCSICMSGIMVPTATVCGHVFCWDCIMEWTGSDGNPCPTCRTDCMPQELLVLTNYSKTSPQTESPWWARPVFRNLS